MSNVLRKMLKLPITLPLRVPFIRRRVAFEMRRYFGDMKIDIPLSDGLACPIAHWDSVHSFSEMFVANEYGAFLDAMPLPRRWLDLGCHAGYFTLYLAWKNAIAGRSADWSALLIDADPRMAPLTAWTLERNGLGRNARFMGGMIGEGTGPRAFALRQGMGSSAEVDGLPAQEICHVPCITAGQIAAAFPPPYDLIKIDIEGGEYDFVKNYPGLCRGAAWLLLEWHSTDAEGSGQARMGALCAGIGFEHVAEMRSRRQLRIGNDWHSSGIDLYRRKGA
ncbi:MAG TPA: FkbM family methyltransferase [Chthoniobacteraceae bacterium]|jgi:FkbM family methyltransferase|nr:FkbM family methyltransferase [Chthoniobacteraceae bacterium]